MKAQAGPDITTRIRSRRVGDRMVTVTITDRPAGIDFADIVGTCKVVPDDLSSAPTTHGITNDPKGTQHAYRR